MLFVLALTLSLAATAAAQPLSGPEFIPLATPCRVLDTRATDTPVPANVPTTIQISGEDCGVPATAVGAALNFTITGAQGAGHLTVWPSGPVPATSVLNFTPGEDVANAVDIGLGTGGTVLVQPFATTHLVVDIYGYFTDVEELPGLNTALGDGALSNNTTGNLNTATGFFALQNNTTGDRNTATGAVALGNNTTGTANTATGFEALLMNLTGQGNTAAGSAALRNGTSGGENTAMGNAALFNTTGNNNTAVGSLALLTSTTGSNNIAIGRAAALNVSTGSNNIHIGNQGQNADTALIRIGTAGTQTATFITGISGVPVAGVPVMVDGNGQLGVAAASSRRVKDDIRDMEGASEGLAKLRPVTFRYKAESSTGPRSIEYGLIAEEVAEIYPELVVLDKDGQPSGVRYHVLPAMLLNELQRQHRVIEAQARLLDELTARLSRLESKGVAAGR
jgi:hypothetical protein